MRICLARQRKYFFIIANRLKDKNLKPWKGVHSSHCQSCKKCTKVKHFPIWGTKNVPIFPHFFPPNFPHFYRNVLIFTSISSFFLYFPHSFGLFLIFSLFSSFFSSFPHSFLTSFFLSIFPKIFPHSHFFPRIQILGSDTFCNSAIKIYIPFRNKELGGCGFEVFLQWQMWHWVIQYILWRPRQWSTQVGRGHCLDGINECQGRIQKKITCYYVLMWLMWKELQIYCVIA